MTPFPDPRQALAALVAALAFASAPVLANDIQEASKLLRAGQHQQAMERVNKVLSARPKDAQARFLKGLIFAEQGNSREATEIFLQLTKDHPEYPEPYNNLAVIYASQGQYDKARAALEQSIRTHPSYATAYENLGDVYAKLASQAYDKALQIDSANSAAKNKLALVRELVGGARPVTVAAATPPKEAAKEPAKEPVKEAVKEPVKEAVKEPAKPPVVAAIPAPAPAEPKPAAAKPSGAEVLEAVNAWAKAWSARDVDAYLAFYAADFKTPGGEARAEWEKTRRQRIKAPKSITVGIESPKVSMGADGQATVTFRQNYRSDVLKATSTTKTLIMARNNGRWQIRQERVGN